MILQNQIFITYLSLLIFVVLRIDRLGNKIILKECLMVLMDIFVPNIDYYYSLHNLNYPKVNISTYLHYLWDTNSHKFSYSTQNKTNKYRILHRCKIQIIKIRTIKCTFPSHTISRICNIL